jgi:nucleoside-diphosphate-sugar epimerase
MKNVLVTGGAGFIGSYLVRALLSQGYHVVVMDDLSRGKKENIEKLIKSNNFVFYQWDITNPDLYDHIRLAIEEHYIDTIIHLAAINGTQHFYAHSDKVSVVNSIGTLCMLRMIKDIYEGRGKHWSRTKGLKIKFVMASTSEVYGDPDTIPTKEDAPIKLRIEHKRDSYAAAKAMSEFYVKTMCESMDIRYLIFRIFNTYGPGMVDTKYGQVIPEFIKRIKEAEYPLRIYGDGSHTRSFIWIGDLVYLLIHAISKAPYDEVYNIGNPEMVTIGELGLLIQKLYGWTSPKLEHLEEREGDHKVRMPDVTKLMTAIIPSSTPYSFVSLETGLLRLLK